MVHRLIIIRSDYMKRYLYYLFVCILIAFVFLAGCTNSNGNLAPKMQDGGAKTSENNAEEKADWQPTIYDNVNDLDGVAMTVKEGTVSSTGLTVVFENSSDRDCIYGEYFCLEKRVDGKWYQVPVTIEGDYGFEDIGYNLARGDVGEWPVNWEWLYGSLDAGQYRIVKDILVLEDSGVYSAYYMAVEFSI